MESKCRKKTVDGGKDWSLKARATVGRLLLLLLLGAAAACANVCTPLNVPVNGAFPAVVNGIDAVDWGVARVQWTTDANSSSPVTQQQILYASAAEWGGTSARSSYPHTQGLYGGSTNSLNVTSSTQIMGGLLTNLLPNTTYHALTQDMQGGNWCTASDVSFTTLPRPSGEIDPVLPAKVNVTRPAMSGTHWVYGSTCGTTAGATPTIVTANWQDCLNKAQPGDDIAAAPGTYPVFQLTIPNSPNAILITCSTTGSVCTQSSGTPPASGTTVIFYNPPAPVNPGAQYKIINVSGSTFQISYDGVTPITFLNNGASPIYYMTYPLSQPYITIHPTSAANLLPPTAAIGQDAYLNSVRLGPDAVAQYLPNMINLEDMEPTYGAGFLTYQSMASGYWFQNVAFSTDPTVATTHGTGIDPPGFRVPMIIGESAASQNLVFNQCAFLFSLPPSRSGFIGVNGGNIAVINSYQQGLDSWTGHAYSTYGLQVTSTSTSITFPAITASWVTSGGTTGVGQKKQCVNPGGTWTITGGTATGGGAVWIDPSDCKIAIQTTPGITTTTTGMVKSITSPAAPTVTNAGASGTTTYTYLVTAADANGNEITAPGTPGNVIGAIGTTTTGNNALSSSNYNALSWPAYTGASTYNVYRVTTTSTGGSSSNARVLLGNVSGTSYNDTGVSGIYAMVYPWPIYLYTSPTGVQLTLGTMFNYATLTLSNGTLQGGVGIDYPGKSSIQNFFQADGGFYIGGGSVGPYLFGNNYMIGAGVAGVFMSDDITNGTSPCAPTGTACATQYSPADLSELRNTITTSPCYFYDAACWNGGNYYFRNTSEVKDGKRVLQDGNIYGPFYPQTGQGGCALHEALADGNMLYTGFPSYTDSSEWTFTNNTCYMTGNTLVTAVDNSILSSLPIKDILVRNNLFLNDNEYDLTPVNQPYLNAYTRVYKENSDLSCPNGSFSNWLGSGQNTILDHNTVWGQGGCFPVFFGIDHTLSSGNTYTNNILNLVSDQGPGYFLNGTFFQAWTTSDQCGNAQGAALISCHTNFTMAANILLPTYYNSFTNTEFSTSTIASVLATVPYPASPAFYVPNQNTLALRTAAVGWFSTAANNLRLLHTSPYISGGKLSTDGQDIGANMDQLEAHQGKVSNVRILSRTATSFTLAWYAPDSLQCVVQYGPSAFYSGTGSWTNVTGTYTDNPRVQSATVSGLAPHSLQYYRLSCAVQQPTGTIQLP